MDRGAWRATVHVVSTSQTWLSNWAHQLQWCGAMALSHQIFNFFGLTLNFSPNYTWFAGKEVGGRDLCHWRTGTNGHHLRSALLLFFSSSFSKKGVGCASETVPTRRTRFPLIYHIHSHQLIWVYFPVGPRAELQTMRNCYLKKKTVTWGKKGKSTDLKGQRNIESNYTPWIIYSIPCC